MVRERIGWDGRDAVRWRWGGAGGGVALGLGVERGGVGWWDGVGRDGE